MSRAGNRRAVQGAPGVRRDGFRGGVGAGRRHPARLDVRTGSPGRELSIKRLVTPVLAAYARRLPRMRRTLPESVADNRKPRRHRSSAERRSGRSGQRRIKTSLSPGRQGGCSGFLQAGLAVLPTTAQLCSTARHATPRSRSRATMASCAATRTGPLRCWHLPVEVGVLPPSISAGGSFTSIRSSGPPSRREQRPACPMVTDPGQGPSAVVDRPTAAPSQHRYPVPVPVRRPGRERVGPAHRRRYIDRRPCAAAISSVARGWCDSRVRLVRRCLGGRVSDVATSGLVSRLDPGTGPERLVVAPLGHASDGTHDSAEVAAEGAGY